MFSLKKKKKLNGYILLYILVKLNLRVELADVYAVGNFKNRRGTHEDEIKKTNKTKGTDRIVDFKTPSP